MKKQLIAFLLSATLAGLAHAQSSLTIYGLVDTGFIKETGSDWKMGGWNVSRVGFKGSEALGNGYSAIFQLEKRINANDGTRNGLDWEGASNLGIAGPFGMLRFGRVNEIEMESFSKLDPFEEDGVASFLTGTQRINRIGNASRYDSPRVSGLKLSAGFYLGENTKNVDNTLTRADAENEGYALGLDFENGSLQLQANWSRLPDSHDSTIASAGGSYRFGPLKLGLGYGRTRDKGWLLGVPSGQLNDSAGTVTSRQDNLIVSADWKQGPHRIGASFNWMKLKGVNGLNNAGNYKGDTQKYAIGYFYSLSRRTMLYGILAYTDYDNEAIGRFFNGPDFYNDHVTGMQFGINHTF